jgi:hypothetical protein
MVSVGVGYLKNGIHEAGVAYVDQSCDILWFIGACRSNAERKKNTRYGCGV